MKSLVARGEGHNLSAHATKEKFHDLDVRFPRVETVQGKDALAAGDTTLKKANLAPLRVLAFARPNETSPGAHDFATAALRTLKVVEVDFRPHPVGVDDSDTGMVRPLDAEFPGFSRKAVHLGGGTEQSGQIIDLMNVIQDDPPVFPIGAFQLPVVGPGPHLGEIASKVGAHEERALDPADVRTKRLDRGMEPHVADNVDPATGFGCAVEKGPHAGRPVGDRLFDEDMGAGTAGLFGDRDVARRRRRNDDAIGPPGQSLIHTVETSNRKAPGARAGPFAVDVDDGDVGKPGSVSGMTRTGRSAADDEDLHADAAFQRLAAYISAIAKSSDVSISTDFSRGITKPLSPDP